MALPPHRAALDSARAELARLAEAERAYLAGSPIRFAHEHDKRAGRYMVRAHVTAPIPDELSRLAAGVARHLAESLDALASSLAGKPTRFPIFESLALFAQRARKAIAPMSDDAQAFLEELQPYHAIGGFRNGPLWILQQLGSDDALRLVPTLLGGVMGVNTQRAVSIDGDPAVVTGPLADGAIVGTARTKVTGSDPKLDMFFRPELGVAFASQGPARGRAVVATLGELCDHVEHRVLGALEPVLASTR